ncbi:Rieske (2Fe-2S) protein [Leifsonia sp. F6_8S_P_1B]|uniref:Cytochrome bc1 complex Rieske iron-sulfur subunit n=1 Tax=Leifsonia williamsii TaxID=3035919 RepID=A0ABT8KD50_9MICO|nr:Rieske (2Fe-2S) protein [Leifsonia williamsii]MDN4615102.1 Rieske (2Fe-2S) protein [Leifsonia williamsii]
MSDATPLTRRTLVHLGGAAAAGTGALLLTACTPGGASGSGASPTAGASTTVSLKSIPVGGAVSASIGSAPVVVAQPSAGKVVAFSAVCTHAGCTVAPQGTEFDCPCHGSKFDATTGDVINGPAKDPLPELKTTIDGDTVTVTA